MLLSDESQILVLGIFLINKSRTQKYNRLRNKNVLILQMIDYICQGKKDGVCTSYYENKTKESEGLFVSDEKHGLWKTWFENGAIDSEVKYINGKKRRN